LYNNKVLIFGGDEHVNPFMRPLNTSNITQFSISCNICTIPSFKLKAQPSHIAYNTLTAVYSILDDTHDICSPASWPLAF